MNSVSITGAILLFNNKNALSNCRLLQTLVVTQQCNSRPQLLIIVHTTPIPPLIRLPQLTFLHPLRRRNRCKTMHSTTYSMVSEVIIWVLKKRIVAQQLGHLAEIQNMKASFFIPPFQIVSHLFIT